MRQALPILALITMLALAMACSEIPPDPGPVVATLAEEIQRIDIVAGDYYFRPSYIFLKQDVPVVLFIKKDKGYLRHNITAEHPNEGINFSVDYGTEGQIIKFTPTQSGVFPFHCNESFLFFKSHAKKGMTGTFEVYME